MIDHKYVTAIIPARGGSKRLLHKNRHSVWGKPMLFWAIQSCQKSNYVDEVVVSSDDPVILDLAQSFGAVSLSRPPYLCGDTVFKQAVIAHTTRRLLRSKKHTSPDIIISLQPNSPEINPKDLDAALEKLIKFARQEVFSVDADLNQNAAFRIMTRAAVFQKSLSTNCGVFVTHYVDVHTSADIAQLEKKGLS